MNHQSCRLIHHQQIIVFIYYIKRDILRYNLKIITGTIHHNAHHITRLDLIAALHRLPIHNHAICISRLLDTITRGLLHPVGKEFINTKQLLPLICHKTKMLIHLPAVGSNKHRFVVFIHDPGHISPVRREIFEIEIIFYQIFSIHCLLSFIRKSINPYGYPEKIIKATTPFHPALSLYI